MAAEITVAMAFLIMLASAAAIAPHMTIAWPLSDGIQADSVNVVEYDVTFAATDRNY
jgi:hypothetical protein